MRALDLKKNRYTLFDDKQIENQRRSNILLKITDKLGEEKRKDTQLQSQIKANFNKLVTKAIQI